jgi:hypothetical protein
LNKKKKNKKITALKRAATILWNIVVYLFFKLLEAPRAQVNFSESIQFDNNSGILYITIKAPEFAI